MKLWRNDDAGVPEINGEQNESFASRRLNESIINDRKDPERDLFVEIYWDSKLWKKVQSEVSPKLKKWIADNKGKNKKYILPDPLLRLSKKHISQGFFSTQMSSFAQGGGWIDIADRSLLTSETQIEIETAIVKVAIKEGFLPQEVHYRGQRIVEESNSVDCPPESGYAFVYFIRNGELHKIGITENLIRRLSELKPDEVMNIIRCKNYRDLERMLHYEFRSDRIPQTEYFRLDKAKIERVHALLTKLAEL